MQAHIVLGQHRAALAIADEIRRSWADYAPQMSSTIWGFSRASQPHLVQVTDTRPVAMALASHAAEQIGSSESKAWRELHDDKCTSIACECELTIPL